MNYKYPDTTIVVFCKAPIAGQVKTRLLSHLSAQQAVDIHIELSQQTLLLVSQAQLCPIQLWCSPDSSHAFFHQCLDDYPLSLHEQQGSDLGEKMHHAISSVLKRSSKVLLIGSDCPSLRVDDFEFAINQLQSANTVVVAPVEDGGYVMVAMTKPYPQLFLNKTWSHNNVLTDLQHSIEQSGLTMIKTKQQWDVDTFDDLQRYRQSSLDDAMLGS